MRKLAAYVMGGPVQATLVTTAFALFSFFIMPLGYLSGGALALVTLRKGPYHGAVVMLAGAGVIWLVMMVTQSSLAVVLSVLLALWLPVWVLAMVLRRSISLPFTLVFGAALAVVGVALVHLSVPDVAQRWQELLQQLLEPALTDLGPGQAAELQDIVSMMSTVMTGLVATALLMSALIGLLIGRWWQAMLYNPGGFGKEFHGLHLGRGAALATLAVVVIAVLTAENGGLATDAAIVLLAIYAVPGLAMVHDFIAIKGLSAGWLVGLYVLLVLSLFSMGPMVAMLAFVGIMDSWVDFRARLRGPGSSPGND